MPLTDAERNAAGRLVRLALEEDLGSLGDVTTAALVGEHETGRVQVVARASGVLAGIGVAQLVFEMLDPSVSFEPRLEDGARADSGGVVAEVSGPLRSLLSGERTALNFLAHLSGVATLAR